MKRKIIQIVDRFISKEDEATLVALAEDGTVWEGCLRQVNKERDKYNALPYEIRKITPVPANVFEFSWEQLPGLPNDNTNLSRVR